MKILLAAEEGAGVRALHLIQKSGHSLAGVLSSEASATRFPCPVLPARLLKDPGFADRMREMEVDVLLNVHSLYIVPPAILHACRFGAFNLHPGPLPEAAGLNAPSWAIWNGASHHGVTLHWMAEGVDEGPVAYEHSFPLSPNETGLTASVKCVSFGMKLVERLLAALSGDPASIPRTPQNLSLRRRTGREVPFGGNPPLTLPAAALERLVRASNYHPYPSPWGSPTYWFGQVPIGLLQVRLTGETASEPPGTIRFRSRSDVHLALSDSWLHVEKIAVNGIAQRPDILLYDEAPFLSRNSD